MGPLAAAIWLSRLGISQAELMANPYPLYRQWLMEHPVWEVEPGQWLMFGYDDTKRVLSEPEMTKGEAWSESPPPSHAHLPELTPSLLMSNPPDHTRLRRLVSQAFLPRHIERLAPYVSELAESFASRLVKDGGGELVSQFCFPLPALVIAELLGVPRADHSQFRDWSREIARLLDPSQTPEARDKAGRARWELLDYFHSLIAQKRRHPADDLLSELIAVEEQGDQLSPGELLSMALLLLVAGHETTTNLLSMGTLALIEEGVDHPREGESWHDAVEELLRFSSPVQLDGRYAAQSAQFGTKTIPEGAWITVVVGSANRDPAVFDEPDRLNLSRRPNPHMGFGRGIHFCLGASLARMEAAIAFPILWRREWRLDGEPLWNENIVLRGLTGLLVSPR